MSAAESRKLRSLDVRPLMARGEEPLQKILAVIASLAPGEEFALLAPFLPSPLIERMQAAGFPVRTEHLTDGSWQTFFRHG